MRLILIVLGLGASKKPMGLIWRAFKRFQSCWRFIATDLHEPVPATGPIGPIGQAAHRTASLVISDALLAVQSEPGLGWNEALRNLAAEYLNLRLSWG